MCAAYTAPHCVEVRINLFFNENLHCTLIDGEGVDASQK